MAKQSKKKGDIQVLTDKMDVGTKEFSEFQAIVLNKAKERSEDQKKTIDPNLLR